MEFAENLNLNFQQFNWVFNNRNSEELNDIKNYLYEIITSTPEIQNFVKEAINALIDGGSVDYEDRVILDETFKDNVKARCVYDKLKSAGGIKNILQGYFDEEQTATLVFKVKKDLICSNNSDAYGCTSYNLNTNIATITIDEDFLSQFSWNSSGRVHDTPLLNIAKVIIHESLHANFFLALHQLNTGTLPPDSSFEDLYERYRNIKRWQHDFMANHYRATIVEALQDVHPLLNDQRLIDYVNTDYPDWSWNQIYNNMAWNGLTGTRAWQDYINDPNNLTLYSLQNNLIARNSNNTSNCD